MARVVEDAVALLEDLHMTVHLYLQLALEHIVHLLAFVEGQMDGALLLFLRILGLDHKGFSQAVLEEIGKVLIVKLPAAADGHALPFARHGVHLQMGFLAGDDGGNVNPEPGGAFEQEGEGKVLFPVLLCQVFVQGHVRDLRHFLWRDVHHLPQAFEAFCDFLDLCFHLKNLLIALVPKKLQKKKLHLH